jgi:3-oxoacyl-[acyl-carrier-protein] synthase II
MRRRVVVTGLGLVTPIGSGRETFWTNLLEGRSGISEVESFDTSAYSVHRGAEVKNFRPEDFIKRQDPAGMGRASQLATAAAALALEDAGLDTRELDRDRVGVVVGTTVGEGGEMERFNIALAAGQPETVRTSFLSRYTCHSIVAHVAREFGLAGITMMVPAACAAGNVAIANAFDLVRAGRADVMLAGGAEMFSRDLYSGFARIQAIAPETCQPFSRNRKGMMPGEGAAILTLEPLDAALARGARIYAEVAGYGLSCDAYSMAVPHPEGEGAARAMEQALAESKLTAEQITYVSAHGTGTNANDRTETGAIKRVFKEAAYRTQVSSIKSMLGHTMGAASAVEAAACSLAVHCDRIPPTINLDEPDPECDLDYVPNVARECRVEVAMNNAYGFGGVNASLILKKCEV